MILYSELGMGKKLNEIVVAGSHDAGITSGGDNVQTQDLDIHKQAIAGVRVFDLRIGATTTHSHGDGLKFATLKAYHGGGKTEIKSRLLARTGKLEEVERLKLIYGEFGMNLTNMLKGAKKFVSDYSSEFLILKFDKCSNWLLIAAACVEVLGERIYTGGGNINNKTLDQLKGTVIVVFGSDGVTAVRKEYGADAGILGFKNMFSKEGPSEVYNNDYDGMQYFGKGGTSWKNIFGDKIAENKKKQSELMKKGAEGNPDVLGMMYWTSTGLLESIRTRNNRMWNATNVTALQKMWKSGLEESILSRITKSTDPASFAHGAVLKAFMPNIVMIDFADKDKCKTIYDLNAVAATALTSVVNEVKRLEGLLAKLGV